VILTNLLVVLDRRREMAGGCAAIDPFCLRQLMAELLHLACGQDIVDV
jgi:hypothetical protein